MYKKLFDKIKKKKFTISVVGLGYIGLPLALSFAQKNIKVIGVDKDRNKIEKIKNCSSYINTVDKSLIKSCLKKKFSVSTNFRELRFSDVIIICVPTPIKKNKKPDMQYVKEVVKKISHIIQKGHLIILECTTYPGTTENYFLPENYKVIQSNCSYLFLMITLYL